MTGSRQCQVKLIRPTDKILPPSPEGPRNHLLVRVRSPSCPICSHLYRIALRDQSYLAKTQDLSEIPRFSLRWNHPGALACTMTWPPSLRRAAHYPAPLYTTFFPTFFYFIIFFLYSSSYSWRLLLIQCSHLFLTFYPYCWWSGGSFTIISCTNQFSWLLNTSLATESEIPHIGDTLLITSTHFPLYLSQM